MPPDHRPIPGRSLAPRRPAAAPGTPSTSGAAPRPSPGRKPTPPPPVVRYETVTAACGHPEQFGLFEDRLDKHRDGRRKKVSGRACAACREKRRQEEEAAAATRRAAKAQRAARGHGRRDDAAHRLPDGAKFDVSYDAGKTQWAGTLTIGDQVFTATAGGVFKLLERLDRQYRESGAAAPAVPVPAAPSGAPS